MNRFKVFNVGQDSSEEAAREIPTNMESNGAQYRSSLQAPTNEGRKFSLVTLTLYVYLGNRPLYLDGRSVSKQPQRRDSNWGFVQGR